MVKSAGTGSEDLNAALARKAVLEGDLLARQLGSTSQKLDMLKTLTGASGIVLAFISLVGGLFSVVGWFISQAQARELRTEERLDRVLAELAAEVPAKRVAAVGSLTGFLDASRSDRSSRISVSVAHAMALEKDQIVRNAMVAFFENLQTRVVNLNVQSVALRTLTIHNRGMTRDEGVWLVEPGKWQEDLAEDDVAGRLEANKLAMVALLKKGARIADMSDLYLVHADLSGLDLVGVNFDDTLLTGSNFSNADLKDASFDGAGLEQVSFVSADLRNARFTFTNQYPTNNKYSYVVLAMMDRLEFRGPDFSCADLRKADFTGFPLVEITSDNVVNNTNYLRRVLFTPNFDKANLEGANFSQVGFYFLRNGERSLIGVTTDFILRGRRDDFTLQYGTIRPGSIRMPSPQAEEIYGDALRNYDRIFVGANMRNVKLPPAFKPNLDGIRESSDLRQQYELGAKCKPRAPW